MMKGGGWQERGRKGGGRLEARGRDGSRETRGNGKGKGANESCEGWMKEKRGKRGYGR